MTIQIQKYDCRIVRIKIRISVKNCELVENSLAIAKN